MDLKIVGTEGLSALELNLELQRGAKFVIYQYCMSCLIVTFRRPSAVHFIRAGESPIKKGLGFSLISLFLGWWGIPWGPIYTIGSFITNFQGGKDVTQAVVASLGQQRA
jgi:hypothetical protein